MAESVVENVPEDICASGDAESEPNHTIVCQPCTKSGNNIQAKGFCQDCALYLCKSCIIYHGTLPITQCHTILNEDDMPQDSDQGTRSPPDVCTEKCTEHGDIMKYYCLDHSQFGCTVCVTLNHRTCKIGYIPKISKDVEQGEEFTDLMTKIKLLEIKADELEKFADINKHRIEKTESTIEEDIATYCAEINKLLEKIKMEVRNKTKEIKNRNMEKVSVISENSKRTKQLLHNMNETFSNLIETKQLCKLFIEMKKSQSCVSKLENDLYEVDTTGITEYKFTWQNIQRLLDTTKVRVNDPSLSTCAHIGDIKVRSDKDTDTCDISGMVMMPEHNDKLFMVNNDAKNYSIKVVDTSKKTLTTELHLSSRPWNIAPFKLNKLVVTFPEDKKICVIQWDKDRESLSIDTEFPTDGECWGITSSQDNLVVTFTNPGKVEIINSTGKTIQTYRKDQNGDDLFSSPRYVAVSADGQSLYVTDKDKHTVTCLGLDGKVKAVYKDNELLTLNGIYVDLFGTVFVCGYNSQNVHVLTPELIKVKVLLQESGGIRHPYSLYVCEETDQLYVGMYNRDDIKVFQLTRYNKD